MEYWFVQSHFHSSLDNYLTMDTATLFLLKSLTTFKRIGEALHSSSFGLNLGNSKYRTPKNFTFRLSTPSKSLKGPSRSLNPSSSMKGTLCTGLIFIVTNNFVLYYQELKAPKLELKPKSYAAMSNSEPEVTKCQATLYICTFISTH